MFQQVFQQVSRSARRVVSADGGGDEKLRTKLLAGLDELEEWLYGDESARAVDPAIFLEKQREIEAKYDEAYKSVDES